MSLRSSLGSSSGGACGLSGTLGFNWQPPPDHGCLAICSSFPLSSAQIEPEKGQGIGSGLLGAADLTSLDHSQCVGLIEHGHMS